jgi:hypothetical protein
MFTERELLKQLGAEIEGISRYLWVSVFSNDTSFMLLGNINMLMVVHSLQSVLQLTLVHNP